MEKLGTKPRVVEIGQAYIDSMKIAGERVKQFGEIVRDALDGTATKQRPLYNRYRKVGRNEPCPCGSGKKFKKCHFLLGLHLVEKK